MAFSCIEPEKLYEKDPNLKREDVKIMQEWLQKQPHLPKILESQVLLFLHSCYYKIERAKTTIDNYFSIRTHHPEFFKIPGNDIVKKASSIGLKRVLPRKTPEGYIVFLVKWLDCKSERWNFSNDCIFSNLTTSLYLHQNGFADGIIAVFDLEGFTLGHLARVNISAVKVALEFIQECIPLRIKGIHLVNTMSIVDKLLGVIKPFMNKDLFDMIEIHPTVNTLYKYVPKECLPEEEGGQLPSCHVLRDEIEKNVFENIEFFKWHDTQIVDESKRIDKSKYIDSTFGMEGTFKKLELD